MEKIYKQNAKLVYGFLLSKCNNPSIAEELTQETFLQAIKCIDTYNGSCKMSVWLCQIAKHLLYRYWAKHKDVLSLSEVEWEISGDEDLEKIVIDRMELEEVREGIKRLPENMRKVVYFRVARDMTFKEIGELLDRSENWARVTFFRAKDILKDRRMADE